MRHHATLQLSLALLALLDCVVEMEFSELWVVSKCSTNKTASENRSWQTGHTSLPDPLPSLRVELEATRLGGVTIDLDSVILRWAEPFKVLALSSVDGIFFDEPPRRAFTSFLRVLLLVLLAWILFRNVLLSNNLQLWSSGLRCDRHTLTWHFGHEK